MPIPFDKLAEMANRKRPSHVKKWCQERGIFYILDADDRPCTTHDALNKSIMRTRKTEPDFTNV